MLAFADVHQVWGALLGLHVVHALLSYELCFYRLLPALAVSIIFFSALNFFNPESQPEKMARYIRIPPAAYALLSNPVLAVDFLSNQSRMAMQQMGMGHMAPPDKVRHNCLHINLLYAVVGTETYRIFMSLQV